MTLARRSRPNDGSKYEIDAAVATLTGERVTLIQDRGFGIAFPLDVDYDPEPRPPLVFEWDSYSPVEWPKI